jgi:glycosyltransferase involved in cell wall biosynthesis
MRIGLIIYGSLETLSGGYLYDRKLVEFLRRAGDQVEVISFPWRSYARHLGDNFSPTRLHSLQRSLPGLDLLLQDELNHPSLFLLNRRLRPRRLRPRGLRQEQPIPILSIVHHLRSSEARPSWQNRFYRAVERRYLASVDGFIFNSQTTRAEVEQALGGRARDLPALTRKASLVAYPAADHLQPEIHNDEIARRACQPGPLRVLFLGNLIPRKGAHTLLEALGRLPAGECTLEIAGSPLVDPAYTRRLQRQAAGLGDRVRFLGRLSEAGLRAAMRSSQVLAVPSSYEGFGIVYLEGMGFGLPAIGGSAGAAREVITPGQDGFLVAPERAEEIAACLAGLAADRQRLVELGLAARRRYLAHPTWEGTAARIRDFLQGWAG